MLPADVRLIENKDIYLSNSLKGESALVRKDIGKIEEES